MEVCDITCSPFDEEVSGPLKKIVYAEEWDTYHYQHGLRIDNDLTQKEVKDFISTHHRHCKPSLGDKARFGVRFNNVHLVAVAMLGRPVSRVLDNGKTLEVTRVAVDNNMPKAIRMNACSKLYGACCKWAKRNGYDSVITYTLEHENGASLKSANFVHEYTQPNSRRSATWSSQSRKRNDETPKCPKKRWRKLI